MLSMNTQIEAVLPSLYFHSKAFVKHLHKVPVSLRVCFLFHPRLWWGSGKTGLMNPQLPLALSTAGEHPALTNVICLPRRWLQGLHQHSLCTHVARLWWTYVSVVISGGSWLLVSQADTAPQQHKVPVLILMISDFIPHKRLDSEQMWPRHLQLTSK